MSLCVFREKKQHNGRPVLSYWQPNAKRALAMGFCLFNNVTVGIAHALEKYGLERVALVDLLQQRFPG